MKIAIQGTSRFDDYNIFLRSMFTALKHIKKNDKEIILYSMGPRRVNQMVYEFSNVSERGMKARGFKIKRLKVMPSWVEENISDMDYFIFLSKPKEPLPKLFELAESMDLEVGVYRY